MTRMTFNEVIEIAIASLNDDDQESALYYVKHQNVSDSDIYSNVSEFMQDCVAYRNKKLTVELLRDVQEFLNE